MGCGCMKPGPNARPFVAGGPRAFHKNILREIFGLAPIAGYTQRNADGPAVLPRKQFFETLASRLGQNHRCHHVVIAPPEMNL